MGREGMGRIAILGLLVVGCGEHAAPSEAIERSALVATASGGAPQAPTARSRGPLFDVRGFDVGSTRPEDTPPPAGDPVPSDPSGTPAEPAPDPAGSGAGPAPTPSDPSASGNPAEPAPSDPAGPAPSDPAASGASAASTEPGVLVDPRGGTFQLAPDVQLQVPPGALVEAVRIVAERVDAPATGPFSQTGPTYRFSPHGLHFLQPVQLRLPLDVTPADPSVVDVAWSSDGTTWEQLRSDSVAGGVVTVTIQHFSQGTPGVFAPPGLEAAGQPCRGARDCPFGGAPRCAGSSVARFVCQDVCVQVDLANCADNGMICQNARCVEPPSQPPGPGQCTSARDCPGGGAPFCDGNAVRRAECADGRCATGLVADCDPNAGLRCSEGHCVGNAPRDGLPFSDVQVTRLAVAARWSPIQPGRSTPVLSDFVTVPVTPDLSGDVEWLVNGFVGGNSVVGKISREGVYTAPATPIGNVTITMRPRLRRALRAQTTITVQSAPACSSRASKSSTIALSPDGSLVAMSNPDEGSVSFFDTSSNARLATVPTGGEAGAVAFHPNGRLLYVANRVDASVSVVLASPASGIFREVGRTLVGSEPTGLALSPCGNTLFVTEWAEGRVSTIDTGTGQITGWTPVRNPRALAITNNGDSSEADERVVVTEFFGEPINTEAQDVTRQGRIRLFAMDLAPAGSIVLSPIDSGFQPTGTSNGTVMTSPNQLFSVAIRGGRAYVTSVSASPQAPPKFDGNVSPVVYVADLAARSEVRDPSGTTNLARKVFDAIPGQNRLAIGEIVDLDFASDTDAWVVSRAADVVQKVSFAPGGVTVPTFQLDVSGSNAAPVCRLPTGIVTSANGARAWVNCWSTRKLAVIDLQQSSVVATTTSSAAASSPGDQAVQRGKRFFFTGRGRWSAGGWSSCGSCHPDGLTDNITWRFPAGPRQTTSTDGSFSHGAGPQKQRIFNWTGILDEVHDFEANTRGVSGGKGAITTAPPGSCGTLAAETQQSLPAGLARPVRELESVPNACTHDFTEMDAFMRTIRPPRGLRTLDPASVARGATLFDSSGGCVKCHGGSGWTASRLFYSPTSATNTALAAAPFSPPPSWPASWNNHTLQIEPQKAASDPGVGAVAPAQVACVLRNVGTFGDPSNANVTTVLEIKTGAAGPGARAQGAGGFNIPSLYGLQVGAPFLHHGLAPSLDALLSDPRWAGHLTAGAPGFAPDASARADLVSFLLSIDATTPELPLPSGLDGCPTTFP